MEILVSDVRDLTSMTVPSSGRARDRHPTEPACRGHRGIQRWSDVMTAVNVWLARAGPIGLAMCLVAALTSLASAQEDRHVGAWELNVAKSTFNPGPPPTR